MNSRYGVIERYWIKLLHQLTESQFVTSDFSFAAGLSLAAAPSPSLEYALVLVSLSTTLNLSIC